MTIQAYRDALIRRELLAAEIERARRLGLRGKVAKLVERLRALTCQIMAAEVGQ